MHELSLQYWASFTSRSALAFVCDCTSRYFCFKNCKVSSFFSVFWAIKYNTDNWQMTYKMKNKTDTEEFYEKIS